MLKEVGLTKYQSDNSIYRVLNVLSTLEPNKDERKWSEINAQLVLQHARFPPALNGAPCIGTERCGSDNYLHREFEASLEACHGCPVIGYRGVGCIIYDARAHPAIKTATPESRKARGLKF